MHSLRALRPIQTALKGAPARTFHSTARRNEHFLNANAEVRVVHHPLTVDKTRLMVIELS